MSRADALVIKFAYTQHIQSGGFNFRWVNFERIFTIRETQTTIKFCKVFHILQIFVLVINTTLYNLMRFKIAEIVRDMI